MLLDKIKKLFGGQKDQPVDESLHFGIVKYFSSRKGFGFIIDDATQKDIYVHHSGLTDKVRKGDKVAFKLSKNDQGMIAKAVKKSSSSA